MSNANYTKIVNTEISGLALLGAVGADNWESLLIQAKTSDSANVVSVSADVALDSYDLMQGLLDAVYVTAPAEGVAATNALTVGADTEANADALAALFNLSVLNTRVIRFVNPSAIGALNTISLGNSSGTSSWVAFVSGATTASSLTLFSPGESARSKSVAVSVSSGGVVSFTLLNAVANSVQPVVAVNDTTTLTIAQSGSLVSLGAGAANYAVTLPPVANAGVNYKFVLAAVSGNTRTISAQSAVVGGTLLSATAVVACIGQTSVIFGATNDAIGDYLNVVSNGTNWVVEGRTQAAFVFTTA